MPLYNGVPIPITPYPVSATAAGYDRDRQARRRPTKWQVATEKLGRNFPESDSEMDRFYQHRGADEVVAALGDYNPLRNGRPINQAQFLLGAIPSPLIAKGFPYKRIGLVYFTPPVYGRKTSRARTTTAGMALLKHWAERFPKFAPFFDAYYSKPAEQEITLDCIDFQLGIVPAKFRADIERHRALYQAAKLKEAEERARQAQEAQYANSQLANQGMLQGVAQQAPYGQLHGLNQLGANAIKQQQFAQVIEQNAQRARDQMLRQTNTPVFAGLGALLGTPGKGGFDF